MKHPLPRTLTLTALCTFPLAATAQEFQLEYEAQLAGPDLTYGVELVTREVAWDSEPKAMPELPGREARRGGIRLDDDRVILLAWDESESTLFVDCNGNGRLDDDSAVRQQWRWAHGPYLEGFSFEAFELQAPEGADRGKWRLQLNVELAGSNEPDSVAFVNSGWTGKVELGGSAYRLAVFDDLDGVFGSDGDSLAMLPWTEEVAVPASAIVALPARVFVGDTLYDLSLGLEAGGEGGIVRAAFRESSAPLVSCELVGTNLSRLLLSEADGSTAIFLEEPTGTLRLPAGEYTARIEIDGGNLGPLEAEAEVVVSEGENVLRVGCPLDNSVSVRRSAATVLELEYRLLGVGGEEYYLSSNSPPNPRFSVHDGEGEVAQGDFRYG